MAIWDDVLPEQDRLVYEAAGWGQGRGLRLAPGAARGRRDLQLRRRQARAHPRVDQALALLVRRGRLGGHRSPPAADRPPATSRRCPSSTPGWTDAPTASTRARGTGSPHARRRTSTWSARSATRSSPRSRPSRRDVYFVKRKPSAFLGTPLLGHLVYLGADTVIVTGTTTSGCVRASAVDAAQYNFHTIVPEECTWDRGRAHPQGEPLRHPDEVRRCQSRPPTSSTTSGACPSDRAGRPARPECPTAPRPRCPREPRAPQGPGRLRGGARRGRAPRRRAAAQSSGGPPWCATPMRDAPSPRTSRSSSSPVTTSARCWGRRAAAALGGAPVESYGKGRARGLRRRAGARRRRGHRRVRRRLPRGDRRRQGVDLLGDQALRARRARRRSPRLQGTRSGCARTTTPSPSPCPTPRSPTRSW